MSLGQVFVSEVLGTMLLTLLGCGVVANNVLPKNNGFGGGFLMVNFGWGLAVFAGVFAAFKSGAHLNPAVTVGLLINGDEYAKGVEITAASTLVYFAAEMLGAIIGAVLCWAAYKKQFDEREDAGSLGVFSTGPQIKSNVWNVVTEVIGTFVLVFVILALGKTPSELGPLAVAMLVVGIGASLGGPTGYAINPARDLGPRIAHALLPIPNKDDSNWSYAWVPVVGPLIGGVLAALVANLYI
ncbi:MIP/aquaporin family protein [Demetria terragena]|uniref:MIP/aquaporin family protein n=1 Tax=Demetria terragena TaxID=63959 RepID=UPI0003A8BEAB|nr:MIP/aquaporin family protein [Demetria terragena]